jgi:hypothetical protein
MNTLSSATTGELIVELERRSLGMLLVVVRPEESGQTDQTPPDWGGPDSWWTRCRGSPMLVKAMQDFMNQVIKEYVRALSTPDD